MQPNPCVLGWVEFFLTHHGELGQKIILSQHNPIQHTPKKMYAYKQFIWVFVYLQHKNQWLGFEDAEELLWFLPVSMQGQTQ